MYEWNKSKNNTNEQKHGLSFEIALEVFSDPNAIVQFNREINGEKRNSIIGQLDGCVIVVLVIWTQRMQKIRIISARKANKQERAIYENQTRSN